MCRLALLVTVVTLCLICLVGCFGTGCDDEDYEDCADSCREANTLCRDRTGDTSGCNSIFSACISDCQDSYCVDGYTDDMEIP